MHRLSTLPSAREQARHALLLLGAPAPARLVVAVHRALFDGDLDIPGLAALLRAERQSAAPVICHGLAPSLAPLHVALAEWPLAHRIVTPATDRANLTDSIVRINEFVTMRPGASRAVERLLADLGEELADKSDKPDKEGEVLAAVTRATARTESEQLFGVPAVPHQRDGG